MCELLGAMGRAGLSGGLVYNFMADGLGVNPGNDALLADLAEQKRDRPEFELYGAYTILPSCTDETVPPGELPRYMKKNNFGAIRMNPAAHRYLSSPYVLGDYLQTASDKQIPVMLDAGVVNYDTGMTLAQADNYLKDFPNLTAILYYDNVWPNDRFIRPMLKQYKNLYMNTANFVTDGQFEECLDKFGDDRFLHGSSFPTMYMGCNILPIVHAEIPETSKVKIAGENFLRLIKGWQA